MLGGPQVQCAVGRETVLRVILIPTLRHMASTLTESGWQEIDIETAIWDRQRRALTFSEVSTIAFQPGMQSPGIPG